MFKTTTPDLASPTFKANPHPFYAHLREEISRLAHEGARQANGMVGDPL